MKKIFTSLLILAMLFSFASCGESNKQDAEALPSIEEQSVPVSESSETESARETLSICNYNGKWIHISGLTESGDTVACYALQNVQYCAEPADANIQKIDIYVPEEYVKAADHGDATSTVSLNEGGKVTNSGDITYTAADAPVIFQNSIYAYKQSDPIDITGDRKGGSGVGGYFDFIASGYVLVSVACRGWNSTVDGTAPAAILDLKAAIRLLKANDPELPGDMNKIIATGGSAGGGAVSLLGSSGNSDIYTEALTEMGAIMDSSDDIYGVAAYCPITNLDMADGAYEWLHCSETTLAPVNHQNGPGSSSNDGSAPLTPTIAFDSFSLALQTQLYERFMEDLSELSIDKDYYYSGFLAEINECIENYIDSYVDDVPAFLEQSPYLSYDGAAVTAPDVETFVINNMPRSKAVPAFDVTYTGSNENKLFGNQHFSSEVMTALEELSGEYEKAASAFSEYQSQITPGRVSQLYMMTPDTFLAGQEESTIAPHWRFRIGTRDGDLGASSAWLMTVLLQNVPEVVDVDYGLTWGKPHGTADYCFDNIRQYVDLICS